MPDYSGDTPPWVKYRDDIKAVVIEEGVTHIGAQCFQFCTNLKSVTIPSSVESIGAAAFYRCRSWRPSITAVRPAIGTKSK